MKQPKPPGAALEMAQPCLLAAMQVRNVRLPPPPVAAHAHTLL
ncbi:hypothetical protein AB0I66_00040 [Streptomyces sp. NPDC050439]